MAHLCSFVAGSHTDDTCCSTLAGQMRLPMRSGSSISTSARALVGAQGWCQPDVVEALGDLGLERSPLLLRRRELCAAEKRIAELDDLLRRRERLPTIDLTRLLEDAPSPVPRLFVGRHPA